MSLTQSVVDQVRGSVMPSTVIGPLVPNGVSLAMASVYPRSAAGATGSVLGADHDRGAARGPVPAARRPAGRAVESDGWRELMPAARAAAGRDERPAGIRARRWPR